MIDNMIYDFKIHSLYYKRIEIKVPTFTMAIDTLEMIYELTTGKLLGVEGFLPLINANSSDIQLPRCKNGSFFVYNISFLQQNQVYDLIKKVPNTRNYFEHMSIQFDPNKGIIQIGAQIKNNEFCIKINDNLLCGLDLNKNLKCIYIIPNKFIY